MDMKKRMTRWRLILGQESQKDFEQMNNGQTLELSAEQWMMDQALAAIYNTPANGGFGSGGQGAGKVTSVIETRVLIIKPWLPGPLWHCTYHSLHAEPQPTHHCL